MGSQGDLSRVTGGCTRRVSRESPNSRHRHGIVGGRLARVQGSGGTLDGHYCIGTERHRAVGGD